MTINITRLFPDEATARKAADRLRFKGLPAREMSVIVASDGTRAALEKAGVHASALDAYASGIASGNAAVVARTTYTPLGAAKMTREVMSKFDTVSLAGVTEETYIRTPPEKARSVLKDHPHSLTVDGIPQPRGSITAAFGMPMLKPRSAKKTP